MSLQIVDNLIDASRNDHAVSVAKEHKLGTGEREYAVSAFSNAEGVEGFDPEVGTLNSGRWPTLHNQNYLPVVAGRWQFKILNLVGES